MDLLDLQVLQDLQALEHLDFLYLPYRLCRLSVAVTQQAPGLGHLFVAQSSHGLGLSDNGAGLKDCHGP